MCEIVRESVCVCERALWWCRGPFGKSRSLARGVVLKSERQNAVEKDFGFRGQRSAFGAQCLVFSVWCLVFGVKC